MGLRVWVSVKGCPGLSGYLGMGFSRRLVVCNA